LPAGAESSGLGTRDALHLVVSLGDFQSQMTRDQDAETILGATRLLLRRLLPFESLAFLTVDEATAEFLLIDCDPGENRAAMQREVDAKVDDGTFAWALPQRRAVMVGAARRGHTLVLHPLVTRSRVIGMFVGLLEGARPQVTDTILGVLSVILFDTAQALENSALYRTMKATMVSKELLEAAKERYREVFDNANDLIYTHDLDGRFTSINRAAERVFGYGPGEGVGRCLFDVLTPEHVERARQMIECTVRDGAPASVYELTAIAQDGRRIPLEVSARVIAPEGVPVGVQGIARDLSDRRRLEAELRQSQKMEAVGRLAGGIAHDFNNLLMVVRGYVDIMTARLDAGQPLNGEVDQIRRAADSAISLTRQLLAFSRRQVLQPRVLDLDTVVADLEPMLRRLIGEDIDLTTALDARPGRVEADPGQLEQVIMNLVVNARDAMPHGGRLTIRTGEGAAPERRILLAVSDTGRGMDAETQSRIFEPFFTTKEKGKGTGLGLSTVYGIVEQHQGAIEVESVLGLGTTFRISLPGARDSARVQAPEPAVAGPGRGAETVLLVEDEEAVRKLVCDILAGYGYRVLDAADGRAALALHERHGRDIAMLLTDVVMPQMSGRTLAERLRARQPDLKVLYMSGYTDDVIGNHGVLDSQMAYLQKPFTPDALAHKVREVLDAPTRRLQPA
jgi:PAS domain S-box-containing protein